VQRSDVHVSVGPCASAGFEGILGAVVYTHTWAGRARLAGRGYQSRRTLPHAAGACAFTLIELLVVIAIVSLLMSILMPSLKSAKELARTVTCAVTARSVGLATLMYADDEPDMRAPPNIYPNDEPGILGNASVDWGNPNSVCHGDWMIWARYCDAGHWGCPCDDLSEYADIASTRELMSYGVNQQCYNVPGNWPGSGQAYEPIRGPIVADMRRPAEKFMFGETRWGCYAIGHWAYAAAGLVRHYNYSANYIFFDGHVETLTWEQANGIPYDPAVGVLENLQAMGLTGNSWDAGQAASLAGCEAWFPDEVLESLP